MCVLILSTVFVCKIFHSKKKRARYYHQCISDFMQSTTLFCQILMKLEFCHIFEKYSNIKFHENLSGGI